MSYKLLITVILLFLSLIFQLISTIQQYQEDRSEDKQYVTKILSTLSLVAYVIAILISSFMQ